MIGYLQNKIKKYQLKRTFNEYGYNTASFCLEKHGEIEFAQWRHPFEVPKIITQRNVNFYNIFSNKGDLIIDIGAHSGDTTVPMALAVGKEGLVIALEPNPFVFKILKANSDLNKSKTNIIPLCFAATDKDGIFKFNYSDASYCNGGFLSQNSYQRHKHSYELNVEGKNLEHYLRQNYTSQLNKLSLIKIDAEGYDKEIIKSINNLLMETRPSLLVECYSKLNKIERTDLYNTIVTMDYSLYYFREFEDQRNFIKIGAEDMNKWKHLEIAAVPNEKKEILEKLA